MHKAESYCGEISIFNRPCTWFQSSLPRSKNGFSPRVPIARVDQQEFVDDQILRHAIFRAAVRFINDNSVQYV